MSLDAGALIFKIQTVGAQLFQQEQAAAEKAIEKTGKAAQDAAGKTEKLGKAADETGKKSKKLSDDIGELEKQVKAEAIATETAAQKLARLKREQAEAAAAAKELAVAMTIAGAAVAAMVTLSVVKHTEFDQAMSQTRAATMATAAEQKELGEAALEAGADTAYSASEAAAAEEELAKAGQSVADIVGGSLNGALALAAAGQLQVARSAEIMATTLTQFKLPASDAARVSDVLAAGAGKAQGSVDDLALALSYVGPLANQAGWSIEETASTISYFASQGILGEKAGTSLRGVLAALQAPSSIAAKTMNEYGLSIYDANGKMLSASQIAGNLQKAFGHLTQEERNAAMGRIFGNESLLAATLLYDGGTAKVREWTDAVDDSGYAARQASMRQDNLAGDIEKLGGAMDTALIRTGSGANDVLRAMTQALTVMVDLYGEAPAPIQATALVLGVAAGAMLLFGGGAVGARVKFIELKAALDATNVSMGKTALIGGAAGLALTGVITVVGLLMAKHAEAEQKAQSYADTLEDGTRRITKATREMIAENLTADKSFLWVSTGSLADNAETLGLSISTVTDAIAGNADALEQVNAAIDKGLAEGSTKALADANLEAYDAAVYLKQGLEDEVGALDKAAEKARQKADATDEGTSSTESATEAYLAEADAVGSLESELSKLIDTVNKANGQNQDAITANIDYQNTLRDVEEQIASIRDGVEGFGYGLDTTTAAGAANKQMLVDLAKDAWDAAQAQLELDGNTQNFVSSLEVSRQRLYDAAIQMGATEEEAIALRDSILGIPDTKTINMIAETAAAQRRIDDFITTNTGRTVSIYANTIGFSDATGYRQPGLPNARGNIVEFMAQGGVRGGRGLTPMSPVAQMVPPNTWRVVGDRGDVPELYAPLDGSARSWGLLMEGFARMPGSPPQLMAQGAVTGGAPVGDGRVVALLERIASGPDGASAVVQLLERIAIGIDRGATDRKADAWSAAQL